MNKEHNNLQNEIVRLNTKTQYDKSLDYLYIDYPRAKRGVSSPIFAIVSVSEYFKSSSLTKETHEMNINRAVTVSSILTLSDNIMLKTLLENTDISTNTMLTAEVGRIMTTDPALSTIIPDLNHNGKFCTIIHKNHKYFVVIGDLASNKYCVRDCNEPCQYNFSNRGDLIKHLSDIYYLNKEFSIDGHIVPGFSHIEWVVINRPFTDNFDQKIARAVLCETNTPLANNTNNIVRAQPRPNCAFIGYVNTAPNDNVDMNDLQRQFGDVVLENIQYDDRNNHLRHHRNRFAQVDIVSNDDESNYENDSDDDGYFSD